MRKSARDVVAATSPDLVIADIRLPTENGIDLASHLVAAPPAALLATIPGHRRGHPGAPMTILTTFERQWRPA